MIEDREGNLWISTYGGGINKLNPYLEAFETIGAGPPDQGGLSSDYVQCLMQDSDGRIWVGTADAGLTVIDPVSGLSRHFKHEPGNLDSISSNRIWSIVEDDDGGVWLGTNRGLLKFDPSTEKAVRYQPPENGPFALHRSQVRHLLKSRVNQLWIGTRKGLAKLDLISGNLHYFQDWFPSDLQPNELAINWLYEDSQGTLWAGLLFGGMMKIESGSTEAVYFRNDARDPHSLSNNDIRAIYEDRSRNLWVGTRGGGVNRIDLKPSKFNLYRHAPEAPISLAEGPVSAITTTPQGDIWVGSLFNGVSVVNREAGTVTNFRHDPSNPSSLSYDQVSGLAMDPTGKAWVATARGLNEYLGEGRFRRYGDDELPSSRVGNILFDYEGKAWIGTRNGLAKQTDGGKFELVRLNQEDGKRQNRVLCIFEDQNQRLWIGASGDGLFRLDRENGRVRNYRHDPENPASLSNNNVLCVQEWHGMLWLGTSGGGLNRLERETSTFRRYLAADDLPNNTVYGILPDDRGYLWLSTNKGLSRFDLATETFRNYDMSDGLQSNQFSADAYHRASWGELFFGGIGGLSAFYPENVRDYVEVPDVLITGVRVLGQNYLDLVKPNSALKLKPDQNVLTFAFAATDYTRPEKNQFAYLLEGFEESWHQSGERREAHYTNLSPGKYTFRVRASNHDGVWNEAGNSVQVVLRAPFYRDWWYLVLLTLLILALSISVLLFVRKRKIYQTRMASLEESEKLAQDASRAKSNFLANMSHELRTPLNAIIGYSEIIAEDLEDLDTKPFEPQQCIADLGKIKSSAYYQLSLVNNLLELTKLDAGKGELHLETFVVSDLVHTVLRHMQPMLEKSGNDLTVRFIPDNPGAMTADRLKVEGILLNLLVNANRFTKRGAVTLIVSRSRGERSDMFCFKVRDTGIGLTEEMMATLFQDFSDGDPNRHEGTGLGLYISKHFSEMMGGYIDVDSQAGHGATFSVYIPAVVNRLGDGDSRSSGSLRPDSKQTMF